MGYFYKFTKKSWHGSDPPPFLAMPRFSRRLFHQPPPKDERNWTTPVPIECPCTGNSFAFDALKESEGKAGLPIGLAVDLLHSVLPRLEHLLNLLPQEVDVPLGETGGKFMAGVVKSITIQSVQFFLLWCNNFWGCSKGYDNSQI